MNLYQRAPGYFATITTWIARSLGALLDYLHLYFTSFALIYLPWRKDRLGCLGFLVKKLWLPFALLTMALYVGVIFIFSYIFGNPVAHANHLFLVCALTPCLLRLITRFNGKAAISGTLSVVGVIFIVSVPLCIFFKTFMVQIAPHLLELAPQGVSDWLVDKLKFYVNPGSDWALVQFLWHSFPPAAYIYFMVGVPLFLVAEIVPPAGLPLAAGRKECLSDLITGTVDADHSCWDTCAEMNFATIRLAKRQDFVDLATTMIRESSENVLWATRSLDMDIAKSIRDFGLKNISGTKTPRSVVVLLPVTAEDEPLPQPLETLKNKRKEAVLYAKMPFANGFLICDDKQLLVSCDVVPQRERGSQANTAYFSSEPLLIARVLAAFQLMRPKQSGATQI